MIQIDMPMPKNCAECPCYGLNWIESSQCNITGYEFHHNIFDGRAEDCPLKKKEAKKVEAEVINEIDRLYKCPSCHISMILRGQPYCHSCGQAVKWK